MTARTRTRSEPLSGGSFERRRRNDPSFLVASGNGSAKPTIFNRNVDRVGEGRFQPLTITKRYHVNSPLLKGRADDNFSENYVEYSDYFPGNFGSDSVVVNPAPSLSGLISYSTAANRLLAQTNPSRPHIDLLNFFYEMKDLPDLFKREGRTIMKGVAEHNLQFQFGWLPLISDFQNIGKYMSEADKRFRELQALRDSGIRRKRVLEESSDYFMDTNLNVNSGRPTLYVDLVSMQKVRTWGYVEWFPDRDFPKTDAELLLKCRQIVAGTAGLSWQQAWNAMPWSWLADWFLEVDDFLGAIRNHIPVSYRNLSIMRHSVRENIATPTAESKGRFPTSFKGLKSVHEIKSRSSATPGLHRAGLPVFDDRQFSILASLYILRRSNRSYLRS